MSNRAQVALPSGRTEIWHEVSGEQIMRSNKMLTSAIAAAILGAALCGVSGTGTAMADARPVSSAKPPSGTTGPAKMIPYYWLVNGYSGICAEVPGWSTKNGVALDQWACSYQKNEYWYLSRTHRSGFIHLVNLNSGRCMNVEHNSLKKGARIVQWSCNEKANSLWRLRNLGHGHYQIYSVHSLQNGRPMCLDIAQQSRRNGVKLVQWTCNNHGSQRWWARVVK
ncbi:RICIN domain-containing protein [Actinomadura roseirufa]|uniref:RICIN domain-containing protein n=1 Tax=Actinomadura roseirufa TaxID=2094049 RepID=UPI0013F153E7|nr:RICIN domain-containing protein [Actinomadura roseirufa]